MYLAEEPHGGRPLIHYNVDRVDTLNFAPGDEELLDPRNSVMNAGWRKGKKWLAGTCAPPERNSDDSAPGQQNHGDPYVLRARLGIGVHQYGDEKTEKDQQQARRKHPDDPRGGPVFQNRVNVPAAVIHRGAPFCGRILLRVFYSCLREVLARLG
jgi:hypothetical protein